MAGVQSRAERVRQCRILFERADREGISMDAARDLIAQERWAQVIEHRTISCTTRNIGQTDEIEQRPKPWMMAE